jgi:hypothetical protein
VVGRRTRVAAVPVPYFYDYGYPDYDDIPLYASGYWYYCPYPAGYYPYVQQCSTAWEVVPAG